MADWPRLYHPARYEGLAYVVDTSVTVEGYQLTPVTWADLSAWCGGTRTFDATGNQAVQIGFALARLGDYVMSQGGRYTVDPADGHYQRWAPADGP